MHALFRRLAHQDDGRYVLEFALLAVGLSAALIEPSLLRSAWYYLSDAMRHLTSYVVTLL